MSAREGQTFEHRGSRLVAYVNLVKLPHTVFALPFALVGAILASYRRPITMGEVIWVVVAFTAARFAAMAFNRIADRELDARNPRTAMRELPQGRLSVSEAWAAVLVASALFVVAAWRLNPLCLALSPVALAWVLFYSYTKRFTRWAHLVLGAGLSIAPVGGYLAVAGHWGRPWWMLVALAVAVMTWVGGFDVFYSLADMEFDRAHALHSLPATLGERPAVRIAHALHVITIAALAAVGVATHGGAFYWVGVALAAAILAYEHSLVKPGDLSKLDAAFFSMNGMLSLAFFFFVLVERLRPMLAAGLGVAGGR
ncbi:MAG: putative 4-hydroxybenzoate polyprenyltransferase [Gemmatimonadota bacterium]|nr:putative 4-hydroxybenzoate polyprenyltransferase [Gemmatimonadota bacterium]MDE3215337.1 putative 4-hydroxybenzoate polyprenyltransferase [Gemmatimonadota bacterium]